jgi:hypothetical protein
MGNTFLAPILHPHRAADTEWLLIPNTYGLDVLVQQLSIRRRSPI